MTGTQPYLIGNGGIINIDKLAGRSLKQRREGCGADSRSTPTQRNDRRYGRPTSPPPTNASQIGQMPARCMSRHAAAIHQSVHQPRICSYPPVPTPFRDIHRTLNTRLLFLMSGESRVREGLSGVAMMIPQSGRRPQRIENKQGFTTYPTPPSPRIAIFLSGWASILGTEQSNRGTVPLFKQIKPPFKSQK